MNSNRISSNSISNITSIALTKVEASPITCLGRLIMILRLLSFTRTARKFSLDISKVIIESKQLDFGLRSSAYSGQVISGIYLISSIELQMQCD